MRREHDDCLQANTEALTALEKRLQVVQQILDEVANELGWLTRNIQDLSLGGEGGPRREESITCMECEAEPIRTLAEALREGWTELMLHEGRYMGLCPDCLRGEDPQIEATRRSEGDAPKSGEVVDDRPPRSNDAQPSPPLVSQPTAAAQRELF